MEKLENKTYQEMLQLFYENESCNNFNNILHIEQVVTDKEVVFTMLTLTQQNYIIVKTESFLYEWCNFRRKNYWSLNNNYRLEIWSHKDKSFRFERRMWAKFKMQLSYMPDSFHKGHVFKKILKFIVHNKCKLTPEHFKNYKEELFERATENLRVKLCDVEIKL